MLNTMIPTIWLVFAHFSLLARGDGYLSPSITASPPPALTPCVIGSSNCPVSMTCTPTSVCSDGPASCTGACITVAQPTVACAMTGTPTCPSPLTCTPTGKCLDPRPPAEPHRARHLRWQNHRRRAVFKVVSASLRRSRAHRLRVLCPMPSLVALMRRRPARRSRLAVRH